MRKTAEQSMVRRMAVGKVGWKRSRIIPSEFHSFRHKFNFSFFFLFFPGKKSDFKERKSQCWEFLILVRRSFQCSGISPREMSGDDSELW